MQRAHLASSSSSSSSPPSDAAAPAGGDADARLAALRARDAAERSIAALPLDPQLLADATPADQQAFAGARVPAAFQQFMRQVRMTAADRVQLLRNLGDWGAARTARWTLENVGRFETAAAAHAQVAAEAAARAAANAPPAPPAVDAAGERIPLTPEQRREQLRELQVEYEAALARHTVRRRRRLALTEQASVSDREWLLELAEYAETLQHAAAPGTDAATAMPAWARFVLERRALEDFHAYVRTGVWPALPADASVGNMEDVLKTIYMARADAQGARERSERFRKLSTTTAELTRRFVEPAVGTITNEQAQITAEVEDLSLPEHLRAKPAPVEPELAKMIRLGVAPYARLEAILPYAFNDRDMNAINDADRHPVEWLVEKFTPVQVAQMEVDAKRSEAAAFAALMDESTGVVPNLSEDYKSGTVESRPPTELLTPAQLQLGENAHQKWTKEAEDGGDRPSPETQREWAVHRHQQTEQQLHLLSNVRADQVAELTARAADAAAFAIVNAKSKPTDALAADQHKQASELISKRALPAAVFQRAEYGDLEGAVRDACDFIRAAPDNMQRCAAAVEAILYLAPGIPPPANAAPNARVTPVLLPADLQAQVLETMDRAKLHADRLAPASVGAAEVAVDAQADVLERSLRLELKLLAEIDAARLDMRQRTPRERQKEVCVCAVCCVCWVLCVCALFAVCLSVRARLILHACHECFRLI